MIWGIRENPYAFLPLVGRVTLCSKQNDCMPLKMKTLPYNTSFQVPIYSHAQQLSNAHQKKQVEYRMLSIASAINSGPQNMTMAGDWTVMLSVHVAVVPMLSGNLGFCSGSLTLEKEKISSPLISSSNDHQDWAQAFFDSRMLIGWLPSYPISLTNNQDASQGYAVTKATCLHTLRGNIWNPKKSQHFMLKRHRHLHASNNFYVACWKLFLKSPGDCLCFITAPCGMGEKKLPRHWQNSHTMTAWQCSLIKQSRQNKRWLNHIPAAPSPLFCGIPHNRGPWKLPAPHQHCLAQWVSWGKDNFPGCLAINRHQIA